MQKISEVSNPQAGNIIREIGDEEKEAAIILLSIKSKPSGKAKKTKEATRSKPYSRATPKAPLFGNFKKADEVGSTMPPVNP